MNLLNLHYNNKKLAAKAEVSLLFFFPKLNKATDRKIGPVYQYCIAQHESLERFQRELKVIPDINATIDRMKNEIGNRTDIFIIKIL